MGNVMNMAQIYSLILSVPQNIGSHGHEQLLLLVSWSTLCTVLEYFVPPQMPTALCNVQSLVVFSHNHGHPLWHDSGHFRSGANNCTMHKQLWQLCQQHLVEPEKFFGKPERVDWGCQIHFQRCAVPETNDNWKFSSLWGGGVQGMAGDDMVSAEKLHLPQWHG